jgi:hypothetical protein
MGCVPDRRLADGDVGREWDGLRDLIVRAVGLMTADDLLASGLARGGPVEAEVMVAAVDRDADLARSVSLKGGCSAGPRLRVPSDVVVSIALP